MRSPCVRTQILDAMNQDSGIPLTQLQVDGGMTSNRLLMQLQADILCIPVGESRNVPRDFVKKIQDGCYFSNTVML